MISRRSLIVGAASALGDTLVNAARGKDLSGDFGLVTASLTSHFAEAPKPGEITLLGLPEFLRDDLGLKIIDFNTMNFPSFDQTYLEKLREAIENSGCIATNHQDKSTD